MRVCFEIVLMWYETEFLSIQIKFYYNVIRIKLEETNEEIFKRDFK
jgi:hypothetical protein